MAFSALLLCVARMSAAQLSDLASFKASVQTIQNVADLRVMLAHRSNKQAEKNPVALTERGFVALRLWDLTSQTAHSKLAQESFKQAIKTDPQFGWAHYGLGLAYVTSPDARPEKLGWRAAFVLDDVVANLTGDDVRSRAHREFVKAISAAPPVPAAAEELAENAVTRNKRKTLEEARTALDLHVRNTPADGNGWFALGRVLSELGEMDEAASAIDRALVNGVSEIEASRTRAAVLLRIPGREEEGAKLWFGGLRTMTDALSEDYYSDVRALMNKEERAAWPQMDLQARADYLATFWDMRAALAGVSVSHRLAEHYRRLAVVRQRFIRPSKYGAPSSNALRMLPFSQRTEWDDRGEIYLRHGVPRERIARVSMQSYESWVYPGLSRRDRVFHFAEESQLGYSLMHKLPCDGDWANDRTQIDPRYARMPMRCNTVDWLSLSAELRQGAFEALATDSDRPNFTRDLPFYFDLYTFRSDAGRTDVVAAVAVPMQKLNATDAGQLHSFRLDVSLILADTSSKRVIRHDDSLSLALTRALKNDELFRLHVEVAAPPSRSTVQRVIVSDPTQPGIGQLYGGPFPVPDYTGSKLMLSDLVLAEPGVEGRWRRGNVALALVPTGYFRGGAFNVFYEIYNIKEDASYSTELEIEPIRKSAGAKLKGLLGGKSKITLRFDGVATNAKNGVLQELRRVEAPLPSGHYRMRITVKNLDTQETAKVERSFAVPD